MRNGIILTEDFPMSEKKYTKKVMIKKIADFFNMKQITGNEDSCTRNLFAAATLLSRYKTPPFN